MACGGKLKTRNGRKVFPSMQTLSFFQIDSRTIMLSIYSLQLTLGERYALQFASPPPKGQKPRKRTFPVELKPTPLSLLFR